MNVSECWELLHEAVVELSTSAATPRQRLISVADRHLVEASQTARTLRDPELREWIDRILRKLQGSHSRPSRMAFFTAVNALSDEAVDELLIDIVSLYDEVTRAELLSQIAGSRRTGVEPSETGRRA